MEVSMFKKMVLFTLLVFSLSACSSLQSNNVSANNRGESTASTVDEEDSSSTGNRMLSLPFYAVGGIAMGIGSLALAAADSENSESTKQSEAQNSLVALSLLGGGYLLWQIGESIASE